jgi:hypothetical protein
LQARLAESTFTSTTPSLAAPIISARQALAMPAKASSGLPKVAQPSPVVDAHVQPTSGIHCV